LLLSTSRASYSAKRREKLHDVQIRKAARLPPRIEPDDLFTGRVAILMRMIQIIRYDLAAFVRS
jgi:hypothetical protein